MQEKKNTKDLSWRDNTAGCEGDGGSSPHSVTNFQCDIEYVIHSPGLSFLIYVERALK